MCFRERNTAVNNPRSATMNIPFNLARQVGAREVDRGKITGIRDSAVQGFKIVYVGGRIYYVEKNYADNFKLEQGQTVKVTLFRDVYYLSTISDRRPAPSRELQLLSQRTKGAR